MFIGATIQSVGYAVFLAPPPYPVMPIANVIVGE